MPNSQPYNRGRWINQFAATTNGNMGFSTNFIFTPNQDQRYKVERMFLQFELTNAAANSLILTDPWALVDKISLKINDWNFGYMDGISGRDVILQKQMRQAKLIEAEYDAMNTRELQMFRPTGSATAATAGLTITTGTTQTIRLDLLNAYPGLTDWAYRQFGPGRWNIRKIEINLQFIRPQGAATATLLYRSSTDADSLAGSTVSNLQMRMWTQEAPEKLQNLLYSPFGQGAYIFSNHLTYYEPSPIDMSTTATQVTCRLDQFPNPANMIRAVFVYVTNIGNTAYNAASATRCYSGPRYLKWKFSFDAKSDTLIDAMSSTPNVDIMDVTAENFENFFGRPYPYAYMADADKSQYMMGRIGTLINIAGIEQTHGDVTHSGVPNESGNSQHAFTITVTPTANSLMSSTSRVHFVGILDRVSTIAGSHEGDYRYVNKSVWHPTSLVDQMLATSNDFAAVLP